MKERTLPESIALGKEAGLLRDNPAFSLAIEVMRESAMRQFRDLNLRDKEGLTLAAQQMKVIDAFEVAMVSVFDQGEQALRDWESKKLRSDTALQRAVRRAI